MCWSAGPLARSLTRALLKLADEPAPGQAPAFVRHASCPAPKWPRLFWDHGMPSAPHSPPQPHSTPTLNLIPTRRSRRLVLSFISTVVNYEYCFY